MFPQNSFTRSFLTNRGDFSEEPADAFSVRAEVVFRVTFASSN
jgi:hypothetical protein